MSLLSSTGLRLRSQSTIEHVEAAAWRAGLFGGYGQTRGEVIVRRAVSTTRDYHLAARRQAVGGPRRAPGHQLHLERRRDEADVAIGGGSAAPRAGYDAAARQVFAESAIA